MAGRGAGLIQKGAPWAFSNTSLSSRGMGRIVKQVGLELATGSKVISNIRGMRGWLCGRDSKNHSS
jgi:hypothetical protein